MTERIDRMKIKKTPERNIDFQVDTVAVSTNAGGYFSPDRNSVTINYKPNNDSWNEWSESDNVLIHEQKHRDNRAAGMYQYAVSPEQAYKLNMHDEISANMASLLLLRQKYLETGDITIFENEENGRFAFYAKAVKNGSVKLGSPYQEDFDKEMALIVNGTRDMWEKTFSKQYNDSSMWDARNTADRSGKYAEYYDENYQRAMKIAYNVGGVDFTKYMDRDANIPEIGKFDLKCMDSDKYSHQDLAKEFGIPAYDGSMSLEQYQKLVQHKLTMDKFVENSIFDVPQDYADLLAFQQKLYDNPDWPYRDNLRKMLDEHTKDFNTAYKSINQDLVAAAVKSAAREYAEQGKAIPPANDAAYNAAVDKIYTYPVKLKGDVNYEGNFSLRKTLCDEKMLNAKLPKEAEKVQNRSGWERTLYNYMTAVGMSQEEAESKAAGLAEKNKLLGGFASFVGAPFVGA